ncbi:hypothetical protein PC120_g10371 [Phytophthora cactorum]|nr:hypothetical protein PC120_g10371 [Phytophthora cactorum]
MGVAVTQVETEGQSWVLLTEMLAQTEVALLGPVGSAQESGCRRGRGGRGTAPDTSDAVAAAGCDAEDGGSWPEGAAAAAGGMREGEIGAGACGDGSACGAGIDGTEVGSAWAGPEEGGETGTSQMEKVSFLVLVLGERRRELQWRCSSGCGNCCSV